MGNKSSKKKHYTIPPNAAKPDSPGKPEAEVHKNGIYLRWSCPRVTGNCPIMGYIVQHAELDEGCWISSNPIPGTEAIISNLENGATYEFRIIAENLIGYSSPSLTSDPILVSTTFALPRFVTPLRSISAIEHERVDFLVQVTGKPQPTLKWFLNSEELLPSKNLVLDQHSQRLTIKCTTTDLQGEIMCSATNDVGVETSTAQLVVGAPPRVLDEPGREIIFRVDELLRIKFAFGGIPRPDVTWFHNGDLIREEDSNIEILSNCTSLKIPHASRSDRGEYTVHVENNLGTDSGSVSVTVADKPVAPCAPTVVLLGDNSCMLEWEEGSDDGGCPVNIYIVEYFRSGWDVWLTGTTSKSKTGKIKDLIPGSRYKFRVKAENLYGLSDSSPESSELLIPELSLGLMTTLPENEEEENCDNDKSPTVSKLELTSTSPILCTKSLLFDLYNLPTTGRSSAGSGIISKVDLAKTNSLPRGINSSSSDRDLSLPQRSSSSSSQRIYEDESSSSSDPDLSLVTHSSLTVLKSGTCEIKTCSGEALGSSYDRLSSARYTSSKNSLNSEDFEYYSSIFGKTTLETEESEGETNIPEQILPKIANTIEDDSLPVSSSSSHTFEEEEKILNENSSLFENLNFFENLTFCRSYWAYCLAPVGIWFFFNNFFLANVIIMIYVLYRLAMLFFE